MAVSEAAFRELAAELDLDLEATKKLVAEQKQLIAGRKKSEREYAEMSPTERKQLAEERAAQRREELLARGMRVHSVRPDWGSGEK
jgi:hypothetical protein